MEYQALFLRFDTDGSGTLDVAEVSQMLFDFHHGDSAPGPPPAPREWGTQSFRPKPPPPKVEDAVMKVVLASQNPMLKKQGDGRGGGDDAASEAGSDYSFTESTRARFWPGPSSERHYRFLSKLRDTLYEK